MTRDYPYSANPATIPIETDYLPDVVVNELSPGVYDEAIATQAQAMASRSFVNYYINNPPELGSPPDDPFNNSTKYQAFIPYSFEMLSASTTPNNSSNPCASTNLNSTQQKVCAAVTPKHFAALDQTSLPAKALFFADRPVATADGTNDKPYLASVDDRISGQNICDANIDGALGLGMSQEGAVRWARGNRCALPNSGNISWSVRWTKPEQILFHYYTDVNLRDANNNNAILSTSPQFRWNPLDIPGIPGEYTTTSPPSTPGLPYYYTLWVQNTGTITWSCITQSSGPALSNRITTKVIAVPSGLVLTSYTTNFCIAPQPGELRSFPLATVVIPAYCGHAKLVFDMGWVTNITGATTYGSANGWGAYEAPIFLRTAPCKVYMPNIQRD